MIRGFPNVAYKFSSLFPQFVSEGVSGRVLSVIHSSELDLVPEKERGDFKKNNQVVYEEDGTKIKVISEKAVPKLKIQQSTEVKFSSRIQE